MGKQQITPRHGINQKNKQNDLVDKGSLDVNELVKVRIRQEIIDALVTLPVEKLERVRWYVLKIR